MVKQLLLHVFIPGLNRTCDFLVPANMKVEHAALLMKRILIEEFFDDCYDNSGNLSLIKMGTGEFLKDKITFEQQGIAKNMKLILA